MSDRALLVIAGAFLLAVMLAVTVFRNPIVQVVDILMRSVRLID